MGSLRPYQCWLWRPGDVRATQSMIGTAQLNASAGTIFILASLLEVYGNVILVTIPLISGSASRAWKVHSYSTAYGVS